MNLITLVFVGLVVVCAQQPLEEDPWIKLIPAKLKEVAGVSLVESNLNHAIFGNGSAGKGEAWRETYSKISRNNTFTYDNMVKFVGDYYEELTSKTNTTMPSTSLIDQAAAANMAFITGMQHQHVSNRSEFKSFIDNRLLETKFKYAESACRALLVRGEQCRSLISATKERKIIAKFWKRLQQVYEFCSLGLTSFSGYPTETCVLTVPFNEGASAYERVQSCLTSYRCVETPRELEKLDEDAKNSTAQALQELQTIDFDSESPQNLGMRALIVTYMAEAFGFFKDRNIGIFALGMTGLVVTMFLAVALAKPIFFALGTVLVPILFALGLSLGGFLGVLMTTAFVHDMKVRNVLEESITPIP